MISVEEIEKLVADLIEDADYIENYVGFVGSPDRIVRNQRQAAALLAGREWRAIDDNAKRGDKVEVVIEDIYERGRRGVSIAYWDKDRWWGSGISSHWQPILYREIPLPPPLASNTGEKAHG